MKQNYFHKALVLLALIVLGAAQAWADNADKLLWDYTNGAPSDNPDNGLYYASKVTDGPGTKNGLYGIKMNSSGYCYFVKPAVAGTLKISFGPRSGSNASSLGGYEFTGDVTGTVTCADEPFFTTPEVTEYQTVSVDLTAEQTNIYIKRFAAVEQVVQKLEFVPTVSRSFVDFEVNLVNLSAPFDTSVLPEGVTLEGSNRGDSHGYDNFKMTIPVDGTVKFSIGGCQYSNTSATVQNSKGETIATIDVKTPGCYHNGGIATWIYTGGADVLTVIGGQYTPYLKAEAVEVQPCVITFKDQQGNVIGTKDAFEGDALGEIPYTVEDLPIFSESEEFRGWVYASGVKVKPTDALTGNTTISALVTRYEMATVGSVQTYPLTSNIFYPEDHELISIEGGYYHDAQHGWAIATDGKIMVNVAGNAQVVLSLCKYSKDAAINVTDNNGDAVATIVSGMVENDGATATIIYQGEEPATLTFTWTKGESYIHGITVYNVVDFVEKDAETGYYIIPANDGAAFLLALNSANSEEGAKIFLPNGTYDLGEAVNTTISGKNMTIVGENEKMVTIKTAPSVKHEGLGKADLLCNTSDGLIMQNLVLENALDYYGAGAAGRACSFHDKGNHTIGDMVYLKSHQDTYYSHKDGSYFYWTGGAIYGTVDYICGGANVFFDQIQLVNLSRDYQEKKGECTVTAPYTASTDKGYVFQGCIINTESERFNLGRSWNEGKCAFLNTIIAQPEALVASRFTTAGMNSSAVSFKEYNTLNTSGAVISPESNVLTFTHAKGDLSYETILTADEAKAYSYESFFADANWDPKAICATDDSETIDPEAIYLIENDYKFVALCKGSSITADKYADCTYRKANARGLFNSIGTQVPTAIEAIATPATQGNASSALYSVTGQRVNDSFRGIIIKDGKKVIK